MWHGSTSQSCTKSRPPAAQVRRLWLRTPEPWRGGVKAPLSYTVMVSLILHRCCIFQLALLVNRPFGRLTRGFILVFSLFITHPDGKEGENVKLLLARHRESVFPLTWLTLLGVMSAIEKAPWCELSRAGISTQVWNGNSCSASWGLERFALTGRRSWRWGGVGGGGGCPGSATAH